jgi:curved DNA-binding protein
MEFKDYYGILGVERSASQDDIRHAYRKLARKYHPDLNKSAGAEAQFKDVAEAYAALKDEEKRAAYDDVQHRYRAGAAGGGRDFNPPPGWDTGFEFSGGDADEFGGFDRSDFFEAMFGHRSAAGGHHARATGTDHHAKVQIDVVQAYRGGKRTVSLRVPQMDADGRMRSHDRTLEVNIPKGVRSGQHLRLNGQGGMEPGAANAGDLYLEIEIAPDPLFRVDGRDVYVDLPVAPWEAALGASVDIPTPDGKLQLTLPAGSSAGRKLRLKGKGIPSTPPGDLYAVLSIALPPADNPVAQEAYRAMAKAFEGFSPRRAMEGRSDAS